jgi:hypothetical protein
VRFLVIEHHSAQDIDALRLVAGDQLELDVMPFDLLRSEALRVLPVEVGMGLEVFANPELAGERRRYAAILREMLEDRFSAAPFDAMVLPSDTFFYVRAAPAVAHALGVPFLVAQKETTISGHLMREHALELRRFAPPLADRMAVCSELHKRFWERAGGDADRIEVTGQPRFDFYSEPERWPDNVPFGDNGNTVLFLSYATDAYFPGEKVEGGGWNALRLQTERGLLELARRGWRVLVKPHPQQPLGSLQELRQRAGELWGTRVFLVDAQADVRRLIVATDVIVGFQSTALFEAMLAGRPVVYTGWDETATAFGDELIPFARWEDEIDVVCDAHRFPAAVIAARDRPCDAATLQKRRVLAERYLGPLDGQGAARTLAMLRREAESWAARRGGAERALRARLERRRTPLRLSRRGRAWSRTSRRRVGAMLGR